MTDEEKAAQAATEAAAKEAADAAAKEAAEKGAAERAAKEELSSLPEWAQKRIENLSKESSTYRERLQATEEKLAGASPEDLAKAVAEVKAENHRLRLDNAKVAALAQHGLPEAAASLLDGSSAEEIVAKAEALVALRGEQSKTPVILRDGTLTGARTRNTKTDEVSSADAMRAYLAKNR